MRKIISLFLFALFFSSSLQLFALDNSPRLRIVPNLGQLTNTDEKPASEVRFVANAPGMRIFFRETGFSYVYFNSPSGGQVNPDESSIKLESPEYKMHRFDMEFLGTAHPKLIGESPTGALNHYYLEHCPKGITNVPEYERLTYQNLYPGIDLVFYATQEGLKYDYIVHPGANPDLIHFEFQGVEQENFEKNGNLKLTHAFGTHTESAPITFQGNELISSKYIMEKSGGKLPNQYRIMVGEYNKSLPLVIDPTLLWATFYGGADTEQNDMFGDVATDGNGDIWFTGHSKSSNFPVSTGTFAGGTNDAVIVKFDPAGNRLYATYIGSSDVDLGSGIDIDNQNNVYMTGISNNNGFPTTAGAYQSTIAGLSDAILCKFTSSGTLIWATLFGGNSIDEGFRVKIDPVTQDPVIVGETQSTSLPTTTGAFQTSLGGGRDVFMARFTAAGGLTWATYVGGSQNDSGHALDIDNNSDIFIGGPSSSSNFPVTSGTFQTTWAGGSNDMFISKFSSSGSQTWGTFIGGSSPEFLNGLAADNLGNVYFAGRTSSSDFPTSSGAYQTSYNASLYTAALGKFDGSGNRTWATFLGGTIWEEAFDIEMTSLGDVILTGNTRSTNFPTTSGAIQSSHGGGFADVIISTFSPSGSLLFSSFYGGSGNDYGRGIGTDPGGNIYVVGYSESSAFPATTNAYQTSFGGGSTDAILIALHDCGLIQSALAGTDTVLICSGNAFTLDAGSGYSYAWSTNDTSQTISVSSQGQYWVTVSDTQGCSGTDTVQILVAAAPVASITPAGPVGICQGDTLNLSGSGTAGAYQWYLNGTAIGGATSLNYTATMAGTYTLVESTGGTCFDSTTTGVVLTLNPNPVASFNWHGLGIGGIYFTDTSTGGVTAWFWDFGDGATDTLQNPVHNYSSGPDSFLVCLTVMANGCSNQFCDSVSTLVGIEEAIPGAEFQVFPIPANSELKLNFSLEQAESLQLELVNVLGQVVITANTNGTARGQVRLNVSDLPSGHYTLLVRGKVGVMARKIIVSR